MAKLNDVKTVGTLGFIVKRNVTLPVLKMSDGVAYYVRFDGVIYTAPESGEGRRKAGADGQVMAPPDLAQVTNLETGEQNTVVINKVLGSVLKEQYPADAYNGKCFEIIKAAPAGGGKRYATYQIAEIELQNEAAKTTPKK